MYRPSYGYNAGDPSFPDDYDDTIVVDPDAGADTQIRMPRQPRGPRLPEGYTVEPTSNPDPYEKSNARDYRSISFGTLLSEDYGRLVTDDMPLGRRDDSPASAYRVSPAEGRWNDHYEKSMQYAKLLRQLDPADAAKLGIDIDLLVSGRERDFCQSFLGLMAYLGHQGAERLQLGNMPKAGDAATALSWLVRKLTPTKWQPVKGSDRDWSHNDGDKPLSSDYRHLIHQVVAGKTEGPNLSTVQAYPLQKLNTDTWLYLCDDGKVRTRVNSSTLLPAPGSDLRHAPICDLTVDFEPLREQRVRHVTHELVRPDGTRDALKAHYYGSRVLAYPAKQRLVDIAGRALIQRARQGA